MADPDTCNVPGSSPLSRGIHTLLRQGEHELWIIPALAGNTSRPPTGMAAPADHPRSRGEYGAWARYHTGTDGSSPLSRGIQAHACTLRQASRIIPALAGNTQSRQRDRVHLQDHPRSRGEYHPSGVKMHSLFGSSPLSRGIPHSRLGGGHHLRIIPALAGNTGRGPFPFWTGRDHPRSRGEYNPVGNCNNSTTGSSPLSRGIRGQCQGRGRSRRIIPALAGNTSGRG